MLGDRQIEVLRRLYAIYRAQSNKVGRADAFDSKSAINGLLRRRLIKRAHYNSMWGERLTGYALTKLGVTVARELWKVDLVTRLLERISEVMEEA